MTPINKWPEQERPREKLLKHGAQQLSDAELLAIFFRTGTRGKSAVDLGRDLLQHYQDLRKLLNANSEEFCQHHGMGLANYTMLQAALELGRRYLANKLTQQDILRDPADCILYLQQQLQHRHDEVFVCVFLDSKNHIIAYEELFQGTVNNSHIYPRTIIKRCLAHNAVGVIFSHNHPSGDPKPSQADRDMTLRLVKLLKHIDVELLDHIIVGDGQARSMKQSEMF